MRKLKTFTVTFKKNTTKDNTTTSEDLSVQIEAMNTTSAITKAQKLHKKETSDTVIFVDYNATLVVK